MTEPYEPPPAASPPESESRTDDAWRRRNTRRSVTDTGTLVWGLLLLAVGGWFFLDHTLGFDMPSFDWGDIWPVILILVGAIVILQSLGRRSS